MKIGMFIGLASAGLMVYFYDWKLPILILAIITGNNLEQKNL